VTLIRKDMTQKGEDPRRGTKRESKKGEKVGKASYLVVPAQKTRKHKCQNATTGRGTEREIFQRGTSPKTSDIRGGIVPGKRLRQTIQNSIEKIGEKTRRAVSYTVAYVTRWQRKGEEVNGRR